MNEVRWLIRDLTRAEEVVRRRAAEALLVSGWSRALHGEALERWQERVRMEAAAALVRVGEEAVPPLIRALQERQAEVRYWAAGALGCIRDARAVLPLIEALRDPDGRVRVGVVTALGRIGERRACSALCEALSDGDPGVRGCAAETLFQVGDAGAVPSLCRALGEEDPATRRAVVSALGEIARRDPTPALRAALPRLRRMLLPWSGEPAAARRECRAVIRRIETATACTRELPLPAEAEPDLERLPLPSEAGLRREELPMTPGRSRVVSKAWALERRVEGAGRPYPGLTPNAPLAASSE
jgi:hypothetical protein